MNEATKIRERLQREGQFDRYFAEGRTVLDVGCGPDKIVAHAQGFDLPDGDAQKLVSIEDASYDTVFSAHCIEHMRDPLEALLNWWRVLRPQGYLFVAGPDEDLYEQGVVPSIFNPDHKHTFTLSKSRSWSPRSKNVVDLIKHLPDHRLVYLRTCDGGYDYLAVDDQAPADQTMKGAEAAFEFVVQKEPVQPIIKSMLQLITCPKCKQLRLTLSGFDREKSLHCTCSSCGWFGGFHLEPTKAGTPS